MGIYEEFGIKPIINLWGTATRLGGAIMAEEVVDAMVQASKESVKIDELQAAASKLISEITGAEAGYITCGAAAGLFLGAAACLAGLDVRKMEQLPDTTGMANEFIMAKDQRNGWDHAVRAAGGRIVEVGMTESTTGGLRPVEPWEFEAAICERTAGILLVPYALNSRKEEFMQQVIKIAKKFNIPVIADAAAAAPPLKNLKRFINMGCDLVAYSGGKALRGPQNTGILCGTKDLIASVALQNLDAAGFSELWDPPESLIQKGKLLGQPRQGIGRSIKVSKEAIIGLMVRLRGLSFEKTCQESEKMQSLLEKIIQRLDGVRGIHNEIVNPAEDKSGAMPTLKVKINAKTLGVNAFQISQKLRNGNPRLWVNEKSLPDDIFLITAINLNESLADTVGRRLKEVFESKI